MQTTVLITNLLLTLLLVIVTAIYTFWTRKIVLTTQELEIERSKPIIAVSVERSQDKRNVVNIVIGNYGLLPAKNLKLKVINNFSTWPVKVEKDDRFLLSKQSFVKNGISTLAPTQKIIIEVLMSGELAIELRKKPYRINITYEFKSRDGIVTETAKEKVDFGAIPDYNIGSTETAKIADSLVKIQNRITKAQ